MGEVDDATLDKRATVIYAHNNTAARLLIDHTNARAERQCAVRGS